MNKDTSQKLSLFQILSITAMYFAFSFHWTIMLNNILPTRVLKFVAEAYKGTCLGTVTTAGAFIALLTCPIVGMINDRLRISFGRRRTFILYGTLLLFVALMALTYSNKFIFFLCSYLLIQFAANTAGTPFLALIPDQVPPEQCGKASGIMAFFDTAGRIAGAIVGAFMLGSKNIPSFVVSHTPTFLRDTTQKLINNDPLVPLMWVIMLIMVIFLLFTLIGVKEPLETQQNNDKEPLSIKSFTNAFTFDVKSNTSFAWLLLSRGFNQLGVSTVTTFLLYYIKDYLGVGDINAANQKIGILMVAVAITTLPSAIGAGFLTDIFGRKIFIYISNIIMVGISITFISIHDFNSALIVGIIFGLAFGTFYTADWTLGIDLLPKDGSSAKNMGIWNLAGIVPQVLAPAIGGVILDKFNLIQTNLGYKAIFTTVVIYFIIGTGLLIKVKENYVPKKRRSTL